MSMNTDPVFTWHDLGGGHGVLELHECLTPPRMALELHVVVDPLALKITRVVAN